MTFGDFCAFAFTALLIIYGLVGFVIGVTWPFWVLL